MEEKVQENQPDLVQTPAAVPEKKSNTLLIVILVIAILLIPVGVYAGMQLDKKQVGGGLSKKVTPTSIPTPDETANWKTYKNEKYGFEVKYDSQLTVNELGETDVTYGYFQTIVFGTGLNSLKSRYGFEVTIISSSALEDARAKIVGHVTDKIDSEEDLIINNNKWRKINYKIFLTTDYVPITTAVIDYGGYSYWLVASMQDIDQILSTFKFIDSGKSDLEKSKETLITYFNLLKDGKYEEAIKYHGSGWDQLNDWNPSVAPTNHAKLLENACLTNGYHCLKIKTVLKEEVLSPIEFLFRVQFTNPDGTIFIRKGPGPTESEFDFKVSKEGENFLVITQPVYTQ